MSSDSLQHKLDRVRRPRVQITYDVETGGALEKKELPFVVGAMADLSGQSKEPARPIRDRKFVPIDRDNFNEVMSNIAPKVNMKVDNTIEGNDTEMSVELDFKNMEDFEPHKLVEKVEPLKKLMETRNKLRDLLTKADRSEELEEILEQVLSNTDALAKLSGELGADEGKDEGDK